MHFNCQNTEERWCNCLRSKQRNIHPRNRRLKNVSSLFSSAQLTQQILRNFKFCLISGYYFVVIFSGAIGALDEYSILMQVRSTLSILSKLEQNYHFHSCTSARSQLLQVSFLTNKDRLQLFAINLSFVSNVLNNKTKQLSCSILRNIA